MKKRFVAGILAASYFTITSATPVLAETGQTQVIDEPSKTIDDDIKSEGNYGALVVATDKETGEMDVHIAGDVTVNDTKSGDTYVTGVAAENDRQDAKSDVTVTVDGSITLDNGVADQEPTKGAALKTDNKSDSSLSVTTGSITSTSEIKRNNTYGINNNTTSGETTITVNGDVHARNDNSQTVGVFSGTANTKEGGSASTGITINGNLSAESENALATGGFLRSIGENTSTELSVTGSIAAASDNFAANGLEVGSTDSSVRADIQKDIAAAGKKNTTGIHAYLDGSHSLTEINVEGSINVEGEHAAAILINPTANAKPLSESDSTIAIRVGENVSSSYLGIVDIDQVNGGQTNILIEGTLVSEGPAVVVAKESAENLHLTVWKIETKDDHIAIEDHPDAPAEYSKIAEDVEKSIQYILKIDSEQQDLISFNKTATQSWTNFDGSTSTYQVAHENERVSVKLNIPDGYKVDHVYSNAEKNTSLYRSATGEYYLFVPKGGGVLVSMALSPISGEGEDSGDDGNPPENRTADNTSAGTITANGTSSTFSFREGQTSVTFSSADLKASLSADYTDMTFRTSAGAFVIPASDLNALLSQYTTLRFAIRGGRLMIFADNGFEPVRTIAAANFTV